MTYPRRRVMTVVGTRPELIRLSRTIPLLDRVFDHSLVHTGQNADPALSDVFFAELGIRPPDRYLGISQESLGSALADVMRGTETAVRDYGPEALLVLGDTNSALSTVIARRMQVTTYHMEAGNRSFDQNVPEEINRRLVDHVSDFNLPYSERARWNLLSEGLEPRRIALTGSPMRQVLDWYAEAIERSDILAALDVAPQEYIVVSAHRQENVDSRPRLESLLGSLELASQRWSIPVLVSTHPRTRDRLARIGALDSIPNVRFHEPFGFLDYVALQRSAFCVVSDSGTVSEESSIVGFPAVTIRDSMERPEALEAGRIVMTGLDPEDVIAGIELATTLQPGRSGIPPEYLVEDCAERVVSFMLSTIGRHRGWAGLRELG